MERFWKRVEIVPFHGCYEWLGPKSPKGYGWFTIPGAKMAHRASWILHHGKIPCGYHVLHKCDNPGCVRIEHLYLGTNSDNIRDKVLRNRTQRLKGQMNPSVILSKKQVLHIRREYSRGKTQGVLAKKFKISQANISRIVRRETWAHI